jgi:hypothetical protein
MIDQRANGERVTQLVVAGFAGIQSRAGGTTPSDVISACLTMARIAIVAVLELSDPHDVAQNRKSIQAQVEVLWLETATQDTPRA